MDKLGNFLKGIGASNELLHKAFETKSFIEMVCLSASQIDALLRIAIILNDQLQQSTTELTESLLFQAEGDKVVMEKHIYQRALKEGIISESIYDKLYSLYDDRNKVVHRYIISGITTAQIENIAREFLKLRDEIKELVRKLEDRQIEEGKGMTKNEENMTPEELRNFIETSIDDKHGGLKLDIPQENGKRPIQRFYKP